MLKLFVYLFIKKYWYSKIICLNPVRNNKRWEGALANNPHEKCIVYVEKQLSRRSQHLFFFIILLVLMIGTFSSAEGFKNPAATNSENILHNYFPFYLSLSLSLTFFCSFYIMNFCNIRKIIWKFINTSFSINLQVFQCDEITRSRTRSRRCKRLHTYSAHTFLLPWKVHQVFVGYITFKFVFCSFIIGSQWEEVVRWIYFTLSWNYYGRGSLLFLLAVIEIRIWKW